MRFSGKKLQQARRELGESQFEFAVALGVSARTQQRYEAGNDLPDADYIARAAERTGKSLEWFYEEAAA